MSHSLSSWPSVYVSTCMLWFPVGIDLLSLLAFRYLTIESPTITVVVFLSAPASLFFFVLSALTFSINFFFCLRTWVPFVELLNLSFGSSSDSMSDDGLEDSGFLSVKVSYWFFSFMPPVLRLLFSPLFDSNEISLLLWCFDLDFSHGLSLMPPPVSSLASPLFFFEIACWLKSFCIILMNNKNILSSLHFLPQDFANLLARRFITYQYILSWLYWKLMFKQPSMHAAAIQMLLEIWEEGTTVAPLPRVCPLP